MPWSPQPRFFIVRTWRRAIESQHGKHTGVNFDKGPEMVDTNSVRIYVHGVGSSLKCLAIQGNPSLRSAAPGSVPSNQLQNLEGPVSRHESDWARVACATICQEPTLEKAEKTDVALTTVV